MLAQGLGKTLQTISLLGYLHEFRGIHGPHMVIVPKSTLHNWINEFRKWCPVIRAVKFHGNQEERVGVLPTVHIPGQCMPHRHTPAAGGLPHKMPAFNPGLCCYKSSGSLHASHA